MQQARWLALPASLMLVAGVLLPVNADANAGHGRRDVLSRPASAEALVGVWVPMQSIPGPAVATRPRPVWEPGSTDGPGPGLRIFTRRHFSHQLVDTKRQRSDLSADPTAAELIAVWGAFGANAGTYTIRGDTIVTAPTVAKNPRAMAPGFEGLFRFRIRGDTLWLTNIGPGGSGGTMLHLRRE